MEEKDKLQIIKERFKAEGLDGDLAEVARKAKTSSPTILRALEKEKYKDIKSKKQIKGLRVLVKILNDRKKEEAVFETELHA
ncbi:hypothetical protein G7050_02500 [Dysgonomonas sp. HDW5A]|uniref:hypothetical protein n=1 Tax=Dysgonomonas sp. HDW5A TaxID=2714926 RepID=UPI00140A4253|nr:hypothetical protein [Dysgonomonas sp. HDW5A]QIK58769.1 hypothetical protein G7050_02500 [Dysgonomonas sp. HDW5A]